MRLRTFVTHRVGNLENGTPLIIKPVAAPSPRGTQHSLARLFWVKLIVKLAIIPRWQELNTHTAACRKSDRPPVSLWQTGASLPAVANRSVTSSRRKNAFLQSQFLMKKKCGQGLAASVEQRPTGLVHHLRTDPEPAYVAWDRAPLRQLHGRPETDRCRGGATGCAGRAKIPENPNRRLRTIVVRLLEARRASLGAVRRNAPSLSPRNAPLLPPGSAAVR